jgi:L-lactate dehydrogenase
MRVGIIRAGAVGSALALALVMRGAAREVVLVDRTRQRSRAVATDLQYGTPDRHWSIIRGGDFNDFTSAAPVIGRRRHLGDFVAEVGDDKSVAAGANFLS